MEEQKVKVVFEFDRKDYENYLFLLNQERNKETEQAWDVMTSEEVIISKELIARNLGKSKKRTHCYIRFFSSNVGRGENKKHKISSPKTAYFYIYP